MEKSEVSIVNERMQSFMLGKCNLYLQHFQLSRASFQLLIGEGGATYNLSSNIFQVNVYIQITDSCFQQRDLPERN